MSTFRYKAYNSHGKEIVGKLDAIGSKDAITKLKQEGLYPREVTAFTLGSGRVRISSSDLALTTRQLGILLTSGATLTEALEVLADEGSNGKFKAIIIRIKESVLGGSSLAGALEDYPYLFSGIYRGMVAAGEASGSLDDVLSQLADYLESRAKMMQNVRSAMVYPLFMVLVGFGVLSFLFIFVIPKITRIFEDTQSTLPLITVMLLWFVNLLRNYWPILTIATIGLSFGGRYYLKMPKCRAMIDKLLLKVPWIRRYIQYFYIANMTKTMGTLLKGGMPMIKALEMTRRVLNHCVFDKILDTAIEDVMGGSSLSQSFKKARLIPPIVAHMVTVGERGGNLEEMFLKASDTYSQELETGMKRALSLLEPIMILVMAVVVGFIVLAILLPIFQLNQIMS